MMSAKSKSILTLLLWNLFVVILGLIEQWNGCILLLIFWSQSFVDIIFWAIRYSKSKYIYTDGEPESGDSAYSSENTIFIMFFMALFAHIGWIGVLLSAKDIRPFFGFPQSLIPITISIFLYIVRNFHSSILQKRRNSIIYYNKFILLLIFCRLLPLWFFVVSLVLFIRVSGACFLTSLMLIKTIADVSGESVMNKVFLTKKEVIKKIQEQK